MTRDARHRRSAVAAALAEAEQADAVLTAAAQGLSSVLDCLDELRPLVADACQGPDWRRAGRRSHQDQVDSILRKIERVIDATRAAGITPLRGVRVSLTRLEGRPELTLPPVLRHASGEGQGPMLWAIGTGGSANVVNGDPDAAPRVVAAALEQVRQLLFGIRVFHGEVLGPALKSLWASREILATLDADPDVPFWEPVKIARDVEPEPASSEPSPALPPRTRVAFGA